MPRLVCAAVLPMVLCLLAQAPLAAQSPDPFAADARTYEFTGGYLLESWNKNLTTERLVEGTFMAGATWRRGWQAVTEFAVGRALFDEGPDALYGGVSGGVRGRIVQRGGLSVYVDALFGIVVANRHVPVHGTSFNWLAQGGGGIIWRLGRNAYGLTGVRVRHVSNGGLQGNERNPDLELIGGHAGVGVVF